MLGVFLTSSHNSKFRFNRHLKPIQNQMPLETFAFFLALCEIEKAESVERFSSGWAREEAWDWSLLFSGAGVFLSPFISRAYSAMCGGCMSCSGWGGWWWCQQDGSQLGLPFCFFLLRACTSGSLSLHQKYIRRLPYLFFPMLLGWKLGAALRKNLL